MLQTIRDCCTVGLFLLDCYLSEISADLMEWDSPCVHRIYKIKLYANIRQLNNVKSNKVIPSIIFVFLDLYGFE